MPVPAPVRSLPMSEEDASTMHRALIDYRKLLTLSRYAEIEPSIIDQEVQRVDAICERISLTTFYPEEVGDE